MRQSDPVRAPELLASLKSRQVPRVPPVGRLWPLEVVIFAGAMVAAAAYFWFFYGS